MNTARRIQLISAVLLLALIVIFLPVQDWLSILHSWSQDNPIMAVLAFSVFVVIAMILVVPVSIQAMSAGFFFGLGKGLLLMCIAGLTGFVVAFLLGRSLFRPWIEAWLGHRPEFAAIDKAIHQNGLLVVLLTRLSLIIPYNLLNYSLGLTTVGIRDYLLGSAIGMLPGLFLFVFVGSSATDIAAIMSGESQFGDYDVLIGVFGVLVIFAGFTAIKRVAKRLMREELEKS